MYKKVFVGAPGGRVSGGVELLHQLVSELRTVGVDAYMSYYPFERSYKLPDKYSSYDAPQAKPVDRAGNLIVLPESGTTWASYFKCASVAIWWLSVDNFFGVNREHWLTDPILYARGLIRRDRVPLWRLRGYLHFAQSAYAADFLARNGFSFRMLSDYLGNSHLASMQHQTPRNDVVLYNPVKGKWRTRRLMRHYPSIEFRPLRSMSSDEVKGAFLTSKLYVDLGSHPGKDRFPREAAMAGCCVVTNRRGSAKFPQDVQIMDCYKFDDRSSSYIAEFGALAKHIFENFLEHSQNFDQYRVSILAERDVFRRQVAEIFCQRDAGP